MAHTTISNICKEKRKHQNINNNPYDKESTVYHSKVESAFQFKEENMTLIIGIDNGNYNTKTLNTTFASGVVKYEADPFIPKDKIKYKGKYYVVGGETGNLTKDKTSSNDHYILTLAAIAKEIEARKLTRTLDVILAVGLPLTLTGSQKKSFKEYLTQNQHLEYEMDGRKYNITIKDVMLFPQGYAAIAYRNLRNRASSQIVVDVGGWTADVLLMKKGLPVPGRHRSLELGVMICIEETLEEIRVRKGLSMTETQIEEILLGNTNNVSKDIVEIVQAQAKKYTVKLMSELSKARFDTKAVPTIFMGGGAVIIKPYLDKRANCLILEDVNENVKGYEALARAKVYGVGHAKR